MSEFDLATFAAHSAVWLAGYGALTTFDPIPSEPVGTPPTGHPPTPQGAQPCSSATPGVRWPLAHFLLKLYGSMILVLAVAASQYEDPMNDCPVLCDICRVYRRVRARLEQRSAHGARTLHDVKKE
jgi:hypothetical protein